MASRNARRKKRRANKKEARRRSRLEQARDGAAIVGGLGIGAGGTLVGVSALRTSRSFGKLSKGIDSTAKDVARSARRSSDAFNSSVKETSKAAKKSSKAANKSSKAFNDEMQKTASLARDELRKVSKAAEQAKQMPRSIRRKLRATLKEQFTTFPSFRKARRKIFRFDQGQLMTEFDRLEDDFKGAESSRVRGSLKRSKRLAQDVSDVARGRGRRKDLAGREKKRVWESARFKDGVLDAAVVAGLASGAYIAANRKGNGRRGLKKAAKEDFDWLKKTLSTPIGKRNARNRIVRSVRRRVMGFEALPQKTGPERLLEFASKEDWEITPVSRRVARVRAPGARKRNRREKTWSEKKANRDKIAMATTIGGILASGLVVRGMSRRKMNALMKKVEAAEAGERTARSALRKEQVSQKEATRPRGTEQRGNREKPGATPPSESVNKKPAAMRSSRRRRRSKIIKTTGPTPIANRGRTPIANRASNRVLLINGRN